MITSSCGTIICVTQAGILREFLSCNSRFSWLKVPSYYAPQMVVFSIQDLVAWVVWLRCSFCIWQITEVIVMSSLYLCFYLYVIFNIEIKSLDMHTEIMDMSLWETWKMSHPIPRYEKKGKIFGNTMYICETSQMLKGKISMSKWSKSISSVQCH